jgi:hypothetical protein
MGAVEKGRRMGRIVVLALAAFGAPACVAYTIVDTAVDVTATAVETTADVVGGAVDLATGDDDD